MIPFFKACGKKKMPSRRINHMHCESRVDYPERIIFYGRNVVHAAKHDGSVCGNAIFYTACGQRETRGNLKKSHREITCKNCIRALFEEKEETDLRFVIQDPQQNLFFLNKKYGEADWVENPCNATQWKTLEGAEGKVNEIIVSRFSEMHGNPREYRNDSTWHDFRQRQLKLLRPRKIQLLTLFVDEETSWTLT
jgi:hypothetical protein